jgi:serpin B
MYRLAVVLLATSMVAGCGSAEPVAEPVTVPAKSTPPSPSVQGSAMEPLAVSDGVSRAPVQPDAPVAALAAGWNNAGLDLLRRLPVDENVVFSPASIGHALLMAAAAADDSTRAAIEESFGLPAGAHDAWNSIDQAIAAAQSDQVTVAIADRIWPTVGLQPDQAWVDLLATHHGADVVPLDFAGDTEASRATINEWVSNRTEGLIPDLLPEGFIDRRGHGDGFVGAEIPYAGGDYSMLVLVPDEGRFEDVVERLDQELLDEIDATFSTGPYELLLPKWEDSYRIDLLDWLDELGAAPGAYPGISPDAFLDAAVHAADITVDEQGTVAAAATALGFNESGPPDPEMTVAADRPFIYLIRHRPTGLVLFSGHVTDPT